MRDPFVRPFVLTRGRTRSQGPAIGVESLLRATGRSEAGVEPEVLGLLRTCRRPTALAEVSALHGLPLGVARVIVGDLMGSGHLERCDTVHHTDATVVRRLLDAI